MKVYEYTENINVIKRLIKSSEGDLFPLMKARAHYLKTVEPTPELQKEMELHEMIRAHLQLMINYASFLESSNDNFTTAFETCEHPLVEWQKQYIKTLENELIYDFGKKHNKPK